MAPLFYKYYCDIKLLLMVSVKAFQCFKRCTCNRVRSTRFVWQEINSIKHCKALNYSVGLRGQKIKTVCSNDTHP